MPYYMNALVAVAFAYSCWSMVRKGSTPTLLFGQVDRKSQPKKFWTIIGLWALVSIFNILLMVEKLK